MIQILLILAALTTTYALTVASFAWEDLLLGFTVSLVLVVVYRRFTLPSRQQSFGVTLTAVIFAPIYILRVIWSVIEGTVTVTMYVVGLRPLQHPGIVAVPIGDRSWAGLGITNLALTLSPGSFFVDVNWEEGVFYVHVIDATDPDAVREELQTMYERYQRHVVP